MPSQKHEVHLKANINAVSSTGTATTKVKSHFSIYHLLASAHFARLSRQVEMDNKTVTQISGEVRTEHRAYVTGAITLAVAGLEARINELFLEAVDENKNIFANTSPDLPILMSACWPVLQDKGTILDKYQIALRLAGQQQFVEGQNPYQDANDLIYLRNALVHYKPEWDTDQKIHKKIENRLKQRKFPHSPFSHRNDVFFPEKCLGYGCAKWAVDTVKVFIDDFYTSMGVPSGLDSYRARLDC